MKSNKDPKSVLFTVLERMLSFRIQVKMNKLKVYNQYLSYQQINDKINKTFTKVVAYQTKVKAFGWFAVISVVISSARYIMQWTLDEKFIKINVITFLVSLPCLNGQQALFVRRRFLNKT